MKKSYISKAKASCLGFASFRRADHIFYKYAVAALRIAYQYVRHGADEFAVLNDGTARHE